MQTVPITPGCSYWLILIKKKDDLLYDQKQANLADEVKHQNYNGPMQKQAS